MTELPVPLQWVWKACQHACARFSTLRTAEPMLRDVSRSAREAEPGL